MQVVFEEMGIATITAVWKQDNVIDQHKVDYNISQYPFKYFSGIRPRKLQKALQNRFNIHGKLWRKAVKECDTFIFLWNTFKKDFSDLEELKKLNKKVIVVFVGDDIRWYHSMKQDHELHGFKPLTYDKYDHSINNLRNKLNFLRKAERYADFIFSRLNQAQLSLRPYYRWDMSVLSRAVDHRPEQRKECPIVLHAPSNRTIKGSDHVLKAFDKLKEEGLSFEPQLMENVPNEQAIEMYMNADIVVDQLLLPGSGKLATEALCAGKVVMSFMAYDNYYTEYKGKMPIVDVNPENIYQKLKELILDYPQRCRLAAMGREYVEKNLDIKHFCERVIRLVSAEEKENYDYYPDFFRNTFLPESEFIEEYNQWTKYLSNCDWYKKYVPAGEREGLIF